VDPFSFCMESCTLPTMVIARQHMWGVSPVGPYYLDKHGSTRDRVKHVRSSEPCRAIMAVPAAVPPLCSCLPAFTSGQSKSRKYSGVLSGQ